MKNLGLLSALALIGCAVAAPPGGYPLSITEYYRDAKLDHFSSGGNSQTFKMRYLVDAQYWNPQSGPILFYAGNEGDIMGFYQNSGFMTTVLAPQYEGLIVFGEHRYFGKSFPFDKSVAFDKDHNQYLTVEQTMMDYNELIHEIRYQYGAMDKPCIVFGGSYGGMLASWLRMKFPQTFQGAYASSAPILYFQGTPGFKESAFGDVITQDYASANANCPKIIQEGWGYINAIQKKLDPQELTDLSTIMNTCALLKTSSDIDNLYNHLMNGFSYMAMTDYPYETSFLNPMPGNPVKVACDQLKDIVYPPPSSDSVKDSKGLPARQKTVLQGLLNAANIYFNYKPPVKCTNTSDVDGTGQLDGAGWDVLACNQLAMPTTNGVNSMFNVNDPFDYKAYSADCLKKYGLTPRYQRVWDFFGGLNVDLDFQAHSNIIFTNGDLDPWYTGGVTKDIKNNDKITVYFMKGSAHHLELRAPNDLDPSDVKDTRIKIAAKIKEWCDEYFPPPPKPSAQQFIQ